MNILVPVLDENGKIQQYQKSCDEISNLLGDIQRQFNKAQRDYALDRGKTTLIINEIDLMFIKHYAKIQSGYSSVFHADSIYGLNVRKMKQKGFIFAYD